jgi:hypothetical protein
MLMGVSSSMMAQRGMGDYGAETTDREYNYQAHLSKISQVTCLLPATPLGPKGADRVLAQADVVMFSGCSDEQTSADTSIQGSRTGAMSYAFIATLRANPQVQPGLLVESCWGTDVSVSLCRVSLTPVCWAACARSSRARHLDKCRSCPHPIR